MSAPSTAAIRKYRASQKYKETLKRWRQSPNGKAILAAASKRHRESGKRTISEKQYRKRPERIKYNLELGWRYQGIDIDYGRYMKMVQECGNLCCLCTTEENVIRIEKGERLRVDHCHTTGKIRGLLCVKHNLGLGVFEKNSSSYSKYLNRKEGIVMVIDSDMIQVGVDMLTRYLYEGHVTVQFTKKDGTLRTMNCTKQLALIPQEKHPKPAPTPDANEALAISPMPAPKPTQLITVFDVDKQDWRSFNYTTVKSIRFPDRPTV